MSLCLCYLWDAYEISPQVSCIFVGCLFLYTACGFPKFKNTFLKPVWNKSKKNIIHCTKIEPKIISIFYKPNLQTGIKMYIMQYINYTPKMSILTIQIPQKSNEHVT